MAGKNSNQKNAYIYIYVIYIYIDGTQVPELSLMGRLSFVRTGTYVTVPERNGPSN